MGMLTLQSGVRLLNNGDVNLAKWGESVKPWVDVNLAKWVRSLNNGDVNLTKVGSEC